VRRGNGNRQNHANVQHHDTPVYLEHPDCEVDELSEDFLDQIIECLSLSFDLPTNFRENIPHLLGMPEELGDETSQFLHLPAPTINDYFVYRRQRGFRPFVGDREFWRRIVIIGNAHRGLNLVVDTNLHIASLVDDVLPLRVQTAYEMGYLLPLIERIFIWFIWTFNALRDESDTNASSLTLQRLQEYIQVFNPATSLRVLHILNPVAYLPPGPNFIQLLRGVPPKHPIGPLVRLAQSSTCAEIGFQEFYSLASESLSAPAPDYNPDDLFSDLSTAIIESFGGRPWNVLPIPFFYKYLHGTVEGFDAYNPQKEQEAYRDLTNILIQYMSSDFGSTIRLSDR
jgi:hypothetical protein